MKKHDRLTEKLRQRDFKLNALLEITRAINANASVDQLLEQYSGILREQLLIEKLALFTYEESWKCLLYFGMGNAVIPDIPDESFFASDGQIGLETGKTREAFDLVIPIRHDDRPIAYLLVGDIGEDAIRISPVIKHLHFIQTLSNVLVVAIQNKKLFEEHLRQERIKKELELAAEMQKMLLPKHFPQHIHYNVSAHYNPHQQVGGDYYDFIELNENEIMFCMADVSGKGVSAAFLMANFQAYLRAVFSFHRCDLTEMVKEMNEHVTETALGEKYITLFIAIYHKKTRTLEYVNCGHNPPVLSNGRSNSVKWLGLGTLGLGMFDTLPKIEKGIEILASPAAVICYTDGLVEMENDKNEAFGTDALEEIAQNFSGESADQINAMILKKANGFRGEIPFADDLALLTCCFS